MSSYCYSSKLNSLFKLFFNNFSYNIFYFLLIHDFLQLRNPENEIFDLNSQKIKINSKIGIEISKFFI